ncbi:hypothetical protein N9980_01370 [bacterium]|nr:hypothetical protein [bacterium]
MPSSFPSTHLFRTVFQDGQGEFCGRFLHSKEDVLSNPAIVVVAYDRPASLRRLLGSLLVAEYPHAAELVISIDGGDSDEVARIAEDFNWPGGKKEIIRHANHIGLREHVLACGDLTDQYESIVVLEDDLYVSPVFYHFALRASKFFNDRPEIGGIGLYSYRENRSNRMLFEPITDETDIVFLQYACSWGQVWTASQWKPFRQWYFDHQSWNSEKPVIPEHVSNWPDTSWLKYHIKYLVDTNRYFVYPRESLTTCYQDVGQHTTRASWRSQVGLQLSKREFRFKHFDESYCVYDAWQTLVPVALNRLVPKLGDYDYAIDFLGLKSLNDLSASCVLGCWNSHFPIMEFGLQMRPVEMNVIAEVPGKGIVLSRTDNIDRGVAPMDHATRIYPELGIRRLSRMLQIRLLEKARRHLGTVRVK